MDIITGKILKLNNWPDGKIIGIAKTISAQLAAQDVERDAILNQLDAVRQEPSPFLADPLMAGLARECIRLNKKDEPSIDTLLESPIPFPIWGREHIDDEAVKQMDSAMRLPVTVAGALMPDAHVGYGLPIGGVLATDNVVIPYAVGVDIACRMRLSLYDVSPHLLGQKKSVFENSLWNETAFGMGAKWTGSKKAQHEVLDDDSWYATPQLKMLKDTAMNQLGTSGTGNHFAEWGSFHLTEPMFGLEPGVYLALLSHSGSRGVGAKIADRYSKLAREKHPDLDASVKYLAWLSLDSEEGQEYWLSMELAGRFASANHYIIHQRVAAAVGLKEVGVVENHHNFAWKEKMVDGRTVIVHRKGATPAGVGVLGIIPGSMGDAGYLVRGKGIASSLESASHGAGRLMSRRNALNSISRSAREEYLKTNNVTLLGGGMDESPQAYKPIEAVIKAQTELVDVLGKFTPRIVRMADEPGDI
ncbi:RtcB family protein [Candidatus Villigracilis saccharophilus]|uniref:RtcB family protein n=1 Tax=Candidatus Villigracilis saccharophilus TaxID=3140684 RepID=UPI003136D4F9|nr:RtcB family protein [Anaerolineales bacterium]